MRMSSFASVALGSMLAMALLLDLGWHSYQADVNETQGYQMVKLEGDLDICRADADADRRSFAHARLQFATRFAEMNAAWQKREKDHDAEAAVCTDHPAVAGALERLRQR